MNKDIIDKYEKQYGQTYKIIWLAFWRSLYDLYRDVDKTEDTWDLLLPSEILIRKWENFLRLSYYWYPTMVSGFTLDRLKFCLAKFRKQYAELLEDSVRLCEDLEIDRNSREFRIFTVSFGSLSSEQGEVTKLYTYYASRVGTEVLTFNLDPAESESN